jgi:hypothetical protein
VALVSVRIVLRNLLHAVTLIVIVNYTEDEVKMSAKHLHFFYLSHSVMQVALFVTSCR